VKPEIELNRNSNKVRLPSPGLRTLQVFSLWTTAVAQPFYKLMGDNPEFFAARRVQPLEILLLIAIMGFAVPGILGLLGIIAERINRKFATYYHFVVLTLGFFAVFVPSLGFVFSGNLWSLPLSLGLAALMAMAVLKLELLSIFIALGGVAAFIFPILFLRTPGIARQVKVFSTPLIPSESVTQVGSQRAGKPSIIILVLDELPTSSILRDDLTVDADLFPNFARLAQTSTWYRRAVSVADSTVKAVPTLLTGSSPDPDQLPTFGDQPWNLFTLLSTSYDCLVEESRTNLSPPGTQQRLESWSAQILQLVRDEFLLIIHGALPDQWTGRLPDIRFDFSGFGEVGEPGAGNKGKVEAFRDFLTRIKKKPGPQLVFLHTVLPHSPWRYLPEGQRYAEGDAGFLGMPTYELWNDSRYLVDQNFQRHIFQVAFVDRLLGEFLDKLEDEELFKDSLVIVVADHGARFIPNKSRRFISSEDYGAILCVPLFIKLPAQTEGRIDDRQVQSTDVFPTILEILKVELDWQFDGTSFLSQDYQTRPIEVVAYTGEEFTFPPDEDLLVKSLGPKTRLFPRGTTANGLFRFGPNLELLGQDAPPGASLNTIEWNRPERYKQVDPASGFVPSWVRGSVADLELDLPLALGVNGTIRATGRSYRTTPEKIGFSFFVPPSAFRPKGNKLALYQILPDGSLHFLGSLH